MVEKKNSCGVDIKQQIDIIIIDHHNEPFSSCEMSSNLLFSLPPVLLDRGLFYGGHVVLLAVDFFLKKTY